MRLAYSLFYRAGLPQVEMWYIRSKWGFFNVLRQAGGVEVLEKEVAVSVLAFLVLFSMVGLEEQGEQ